MTQGSPKPLNLSCSIQMAPRDERGSDDPPTSPSGPSGGPFYASLPKSSMFGEDFSGSIHSPAPSQCTHGFGEKITGIKSIASRQRALALGNHVVKRSMAFFE